MFRGSHVEAILFDLDGTIIDTEDMWAQATAEVLKEYGIKYTNEVKKTAHDLAHGLPPIQGMRLIQNRFSICESVDVLSEKKKKYAYSIMKNNMRFIPGFLGFFQIVKKNRLKVAIVTNCSKDFIGLADQRLQLSKLFNNAIFNPSNVGNKPKPEPAVFIHAAEALDTRPSSCLVIEDSAVGISAARAAGMYCIGINTSNDRQSLLSADQIVETYGEISILIF